MQFSRNLKPSTPAGRRLVVEWVSISTDRSRITGKGGSSGWARQAAAQASLSMKGFPIPAVLQPADYYRFPAALLGECSWMDLAARMESVIVLGADRKMADTLIVNIRQAILKEVKAAYQKIEIVEEFFCGEDSYFKLCEPQTEHEQDPGQGVKRRRGGKEAAGSNKRARKE